MKKLVAVNFIIAFVMILGSCGTSNNVVSNRLISKRKYTKGFHINKKSHLKSKSAEDGQSLANDDSDSKSTFIAEEVQVSTPVAVISDNEVATIENVEVSTEEVTDVVTVNETKSSNEVEVESTHQEKQVDLQENSTKELKKDLKSAMKQSKKSSKGSSDDTMLILAIICAIILPPLGVLVYTNIDWMKVLIALLLTLLFYLPGLIYALLVIFDKI